MTSMYSKPIQSELYPETSQESVCTPIQSKLDVDLVDTIKFAVAKLKNINEEQGQSRAIQNVNDSQNIHVPYVKKIALTIRKPFIVLVV